MAQVFISYRRDDSAYVSAVLSEKLQDRLGPGSVFYDIDAIPIGVDFRAYIANAVGECDALLVVIGDTWLTVADSDGTRRLDAPGDYVRIEIEAALQRDIPLVPVLVGGAEMPSAKDLPESIRDLVYRNAAEVRAGKDFQQHIARLVEGLVRACEPRTPPAPAASPSKPSAPPAPKPPIAFAPPRLPADEVTDDELRGSITNGLVAGLLGSFREEKIWIGQNIPADKLARALAAYAPGVSPDDVLLLYDNTVLGSAKDGLVLTPDAVHWRNDAVSGPMSHRYEDVGRVVAERHVVGGSILLDASRIRTNLGDQPKRVAEVLAEVIGRLCAARRGLGASESRPARTGAGRDRGEALRRFRECVGTFQEPALRVGEEIPPSKLANAIATYASHLHHGEVIALYDNTVFGSAKDGMLFTADAVYWREDQFSVAGARAYDQIEEVRTEPHSLSASLWIDDLRIKLANGEAKGVARVLCEALKALAGP